MQELPVTTPNIVKNALILLARSASNESFQISQWYIMRQLCETFRNGPQEQAQYQKVLPVALAGHQEVRLDVEQIHTVHLVRKQSFLGISAVIRADDVAVA